MDAKVSILQVAKCMPRAVSVNVVGPPIVRFWCCEFGKEKPGLTVAAKEAPGEDPGQLAFLDAGR
jgi:hypothetical protein